MISSTKNSTLPTHPYHEHHQKSNLKKQQTKFLDSGLSRSHNRRPSHQSSIENSSSSGQCLSPKLIKPTGRPEIGLRALRMMNNYLANQLLHHHHHPPPPLLQLESIGPYSTIPRPASTTKTTTELSEWLRDLQSQVKQLLEPLKTVEDTKPLAAVQEGFVYLKKIFGTKGDPDLTQVIEKLKTELDQQNILEAKLTAQKAVSVSRLCLFNPGLTVFAVE
ncbi:hypothetical protein PPACK8108_LOCUS14278 [Phakopsora pachyrhizi]|uniref:Uncharacterized protein n=1 Tax=Phakopsora pachyrhizi TaxID=170000 RepID=A0AAV0B6Y4_PHAPC|nr:hypothetical protein PPACK8108_LOCUS14278 [Phakopsora pachyrhizi]